MTRRFTACAAFAGNTEQMVPEKRLIKIEKKGKIVSAGSIMAVLGACIVCGDEITLRAEGTDEEEAIQALSEYFK